MLLGALFAIAENRIVLLPNNSMSASFMLGMAAVVVFAASGAILGPLARRHVRRARISRTSASVNGR